VIYARHALASVEDAKFAVLMQNDDYGKDYYAGFRAGLGKETGRIVRMASYEVTDSTVESQIVRLKDSGANVFFDIAAPKFAAQSIRQMAELGWKPAHYLNNVSASVGAVMKPAGFDNAQGIITAVYLKDPTDRKWEDDSEMKVWREWMASYMPKANQGDANYVYAYAVSSLMHETLKKCGDTLTRENVMKQATSFQKLRLPLLLPGITVNTSPTDYFPLQAVQLQRFKGESWELFGDILAAEST
jgi:branched-chain amino acid transport system substrate-binding protein